MIVYLLDGNGKRVGFTYPQAEALLRGEVKMKHGNWVLPEDSPYEFKNNGFIRRANKRPAVDKTTSSTTRESAKPREQAEDALRNDTVEE